MLDLAYFVGSLAGAAVLTALAVIRHPASPLWKWLLRGGIAVFCICAVVIAGHYLKPDLFAEDRTFFYFDVVLDRPTISLTYPINVINKSQGPFRSVVTHISLSSAKRNADSLEYYALGGLQFRANTLYSGDVRIGREISEGDWCFESDAVKGDKSFFFLERLQIVRLDGRIVRIIDVWEHGKKIYSSPRPSGFIDTPTPFPLNADT